MSSLNRRIALSSHPAARMLRGLRRRVRAFSLPAPVFLVRSLLAIFLTLRAIYHFLARIFVCEPLFKGYCTQFGRGLRTGSHIHWVIGGGRLIVGNYVAVEGKCSFMFAVSYSEAPTLLIGDRTIIGHGCSFTVGRQVSIGSHCLLASDVQIFDSPGHPTDPALRKLGRPANPEDVRAIKIEDNVWVGKNAIVFPGVTIGEGSVVAIGSHVMTDVPPYTLVAGRPARVIARLVNNGAQENVTSQAPHHKNGDGSESPQTLQEVTAIICSIVGIQRLDPDEDFYDAGVTSIMVLPLLTEVEDRFHISIPQEAFLNARTCRLLSAQIAGVIRDQLIGSSLHGK